MKSLLNFFLLIALGFAQHGSGAEERIERPELPGWKLKPSDDIFQALDTFYAFRLAVFREDWKAAASLCVAGPMWSTTPPATENLRDLIPKELRDPSTKIRLGPVISTGHNMGLELNPGEHSISFHRDKRWFIVSDK
jgi:hypothetical protein